MARARTPRASWIDTGLQALATGGPEAVRIEVLAKDLGVTKGGFYGFFADRNDLLHAMLDTWEQRAAADVLAQLEYEAGDPISRALRARDLTFASDLFPIELAIREWSRRDPDVAQRLHRVDRQRIDLLREAIGTVCTDPIDVEARSSLAFYAAIGAHFATVDHGELNSAQVDAASTALLFGGEDVS